MAALKPNFAQTVFALDLLICVHPMRLQNPGEVDFPGAAGLHLN